MRIFELSPLMESITQALEEGREPDPAQVALLVQEGPKAVDEFLDAIDNVKSDVDALDKRLKELKARKEAREQAVERMEGALVDILKRHFPKHDRAGVLTGYGIKTAFSTSWVQSTTTYNVIADFAKTPQFFKQPEPELKKKEVIEAYKNGNLPAGVVVTEGATESLRVRR